MNATQTARRPRSQKATDQELIDAYAELGSVHKVGDRFGIRGSSAHERLKKIGVAKPMNRFTEADRDRLRADYAIYRSQGRVAELAKEMGRTVQFLSRQAGKLGIATFHYERRYLGAWKYLTKNELRGRFDDFKRSGLTLSAYCEAKEYDSESMANFIRPLWPDEWEHALESAWPEGTAYRDGRIFEYKVRDELSSRGFHATRTNWSTTPADVIAFTHGQIMYVQCKRREHSISSEEWNELYDIAASVGAIPVLAFVGKDGGTEYGRITARKGNSQGSRRPIVTFNPQITLSPAYESH